MFSSDVRGSVVSPLMTSTNSWTATPCTCAFQGFPEKSPGDPSKSRSWVIFLGPSWVVHGGSPNEKNMEEIMMMISSSFFWGWSQISRVLVVFWVVEHDSVLWCRWSVQNFTFSSFLRMCDPDSGNVIQDGLARLLSWVDALGNLGASKPCACKELVFRTSHKVTKPTVWSLQDILCNTCSKNYEWIPGMTHQLTIRKTLWKLGVGCI